MAEIHRMAFAIENVPLWAVALARQGVYDASVDDGHRKSLLRPADGREVNMTRQEIATLACKILAVWMFVQTALMAYTVVNMFVSLLIGVFGNGRFGADLAIAGFACIHVLVMLLIGLVLWFKGSALAARMVSDDPTPVTRPDMTQQAVLAVALTAVGVFALISVVRPMATSIIHMSLAEETWASPRWQADFWSSMIGLALAIWLIFGSRGIARFVLWVRTAGVNSGGESTDA